MTNETQMRSVGDIKQCLRHSSENYAKPKPHQQSLFATCVTKIPRHSSQPHQLPKESDSISLAKHFRSNDTIHVTIRFCSSTRQNDVISLPQSIDRAHQNRLEKHISSRTSIAFPINTKHSIDVTKRNLKQQQERYDCPANSIEEKHIDTASSIVTMKNVCSDKTDSVKEHSRNTKRKKSRICFAKYCYQCSCLHVMASILGALLLSIAIAAALVGSLITSKTTTALTESISASLTTNLATTESVTNIVTTELVTTELITKNVTLLTTTSETVYGVWNTTFGSDSTPSTVGMGVGEYYPGEIPNYAFDNTTSTKYTSFGTCILASGGSLSCGENTGLYLTPQRGPSLLQALQFCTGNDLPNRDPFTITVEGSNQSSLLLTLGSSWTLIYNGSTGLQPIISRYVCGASQALLNNSIWYSSYRILVASKRGSDTSTQYSEVKLMGYQ